MPGVRLDNATLVRPDGWATYNHRLGGGLIRTTGRTPDGKWITSDQPCPGSRKPALNQTEPTPYLSRARSRARHNEHMKRLRERRAYYQDIIQNGGYFNGCRLQLVGVVEGIRFRLVPSSAAARLRELILAGVGVVPALPIVGGHEDDPLRRSCGHRQRSLATTLGELLHVWCLAVGLSWRNRRIAIHIHRRPLDRTYVNRFGMNLRIVAEG